MLLRLRRFEQATTFGVFAFFGFRRRDFYLDDGFRLQFGDSFGLWF